MLLCFTIFMSLACLSQNQEYLAGNGANVDGIKFSGQNSNFDLKNTHQNQVQTTPNQYPSLQTRNQGQDANALKPLINQQPKNSPQNPIENSKNLQGSYLPKKNQNDDRNNDFKLLERLADALDIQNSHAIIFKADKEYQPNKIDETKLIKFVEEKIETKILESKQPSTLITDSDLVVDHKQIEGQQNSDRPIQLPKIEQTDIENQKTVVEGPQNFNLRKYIEYTVFVIILLIVGFMWVKRQKNGLKKSQPNEANTDVPNNLQGSELLGEDLNQ